MLQSFPYEAYYASMMYGQQQMVRLCVLHDVRIVLGSNNLLSICMHGVSSGLPLCDIRAGRC